MKTSTHPTALEIRNILVAVDFGGISDGAVARGLELEQLFDAELEAVHVVAKRSTRGPFLSGRSAVGQAGVVMVPGAPGTTLVERVRAGNVDLVVLGALRERRRLDFRSTAREVYAKAPCSIWMQPEEPARIRSLVVGVDDSAESLQALASAIDLAQRLKARVRAVHVFDPSPYTQEEWPLFPSSERNLDPSESACGRFERDMNAMDWRGVDHCWEFRVGKLARALRAELASADLLVLGSRARSTFVSTALGSVAYSLLARSAKPVWIVRARPE